MASFDTSALPCDAAPRGHAAFKRLTKGRKRRLADLMALSPKRDPFCAGSPGQRAKAEWFHGIWQQYVTSAKAHLRRIHYLLISQPDPRKADGTPTRLFYISDFDPAGDRMPVALSRQIEYWLDVYAPDADIKLTPLALTREQVQAYHLPRVPIKDSDLRKAGFEERHGAGAVELDALEALYPGTLAAIVRAALKPYLDVTLEARFAETAEEAQAEAADRWREQTEDLRDHLAEIRDEAQTIYGRYRPRLERLQAALEQELAPLREALGALAGDVTRAREAFNPELPERPAAEEVDEDDTPWLYDSQRTYAEQLSAYKVHCNGTHPEEEPEC